MSNVWIDYVVPAGASGDGDDLPIFDLNMAIPVGILPPAVLTSSSIQFFGHVESGRFLRLAPAGVPLSQAVTPGTLWIPNNNAMRYFRTLPTLIMGTASSEAADRTFKILLKYIG